MVNLEGRVQSFRGLGGKLTKDKPNNYTLTLNVYKIFKKRYLRADVSKGRESPDRTQKTNSILFYQKIPLGG